MKRLIALLIMNHIVVMTFAQETSELKRKTEVPSFKTLKFESNQMDLGDALELKNRQVQIKLQNIGNAPIIIRKVSTTANLRVKSFPHQAIMPGQEAAIIMEHWPGQDGQFLETFVVESNASNTMEVLKIFGTIAIKEVSLN